MRTGYCLVICALLAWPAAAMRLRVAGDHVNLRAKPDSQTEVVGQVNAGDELVGTGTTEGEWTQVVPPVGVDLWIFAALVKSGAVSVNRAQIRSGAGFNYKVVGKLERGARIQTRGQLGDWLKIAPPAGSTLWVSSKYVVAVVPKALPKPDPPPKPEPTPPEPPPDPPPAERPLPPPAHPRAGGATPSNASGVETITVPSTLQGQTLSDSHAQGARRTFTGILSKTGWVWRSPSAFRLIERDARGRAVTVCYVTGNDAQLKPLLGRELTIVGREFWLTGAAYPAVSAERITRRN